MLRPNFDSNIRWLTRRLLYRFQKVSGVDLFGVFEQALTEVQDVERLHVPTTLRTHQKCDFHDALAEILSSRRHWWNARRLRLLSFREGRIGQQSGQADQRD